jgi:hypothetical protein
MSRSYKKTPIHGNCGSSEKDDKIIAHKKYRKHVKDDIAAAHGDIDSLDELLCPIEDEVCDMWSMSKDGKTYTDPTIYEEDSDWIKIWKKKMLRK